MSESIQRKGLKYIVANVAHFMMKPDHSAVHNKYKNCLIQLKVIISRLKDQQ